MIIKNIAYGMRLFKRTYKIAFLVLITFCWQQIAWSQCPTPCTTHTLSANTADIPICGSGDSFSLEDDIDMNSDCEDATGGNCFEFVFTRHDPSINSITADIGQGGCGGEIDIFYTLTDGDCTTYPSSGSQNNITFLFGVSNEMKIYICDGSSGNVAICDICINCPPPTGIIDISDP